MTLLAALLALVILSLSALGYLEVFHASARSVREAGEWTQLVARAESTMEGATLGDALQAQQGLPDSAGDDGYAHTVDVRQWRPGVREVIVTVRSPRGTAFTLRRLSREHRR